jgi:hypothetical protein
MELKIKAHSKGRSVLSLIEIVYQRARLFSLCTIQEFLETTSEDQIPSKSLYQ